MALKLCIFFLSALLCSPFILKQKEGPITISSSGNLGFGNQTGSGVKAGQVSAFINYINTASTNFRDDDESVLNYISFQMNTIYGYTDYTYSVYLALEKAFTWTIYPYGGVYASVAPGVDRIYPRHSYMFVLEKNWGSRNYLASVNQKGIGIDSQTEFVIRNIILKYESYSPCICSTTDNQNIAYALQSYDKNNWNVICSAAYDMSAVVYPYAYKYIYTSPK